MTLRAQAPANGDRVPEKATDVVMEAIRRAEGV
jgi:hypothetical protein